ncbi:MAG: redox-sensing transcriptional repressor Rex [Candidatus Eremiobacteraeota bacterium]|nr:redox-sensing transcriptional repressor Rex [Candidatus Eremiobacteraeota bacterium]
MEKRTRVPEPTIARLATYFRCLADLADQEVNVVSSEEIAFRAGVKASQVRKDLSYFGEFGVQGLGYPVPGLLSRVASILQLDQQHRVALVGAGNLGTALAGFPGFARWNFHILWIFDSSPARVGQEINKVVVESMSVLPRKLPADLGILAVPGHAAEDVAKLLVASGVNALLNFTGAHLHLGPEVSVRNVDLTHELAILAYHAQRPPVGGEGE